MAALQILGGIANFAHAIPTPPQCGEVPVYGDAPAYREAPSYWPVPALVESDRPEYPASTVAEHPPSPLDVYRAPVPIELVVPPEMVVTVHGVEKESAYVTEVFTGAVPTTITRTLPSIIQPAVQRVAETERRRETKLREAAPTKDQVSHLAQTQVETQAIERPLNGTVHKALTATKVATQVVDRLLTETVTTTEMETATATETVNNTVTMTATATQLPAGLPKAVHITFTVTVCKACHVAVPAHTPSAAGPEYSPPAAALPYSPAAAAPAPARATHSVAVGGEAGLVYTPSWVEAAVGDTVHFAFYSQSHTVTQSTFDKPCVRNAVTGADSGFKPNRDNALAVPPTWDFVVDTPNATWWYCAHGTHCGTGMVFAINPTRDKTFEAFKEAAVAQNGTYPITATSITTTATAMPSFASTPLLEGGVAKEDPLATATGKPVPTEPPQMSIPYAGAGAGQEGPIGSVGDELPSPTPTTAAAGGDRPVLDLGVYTNTALMSSRLVLHIPMPSVA